ncbi:hypothetical protein ACFLVN_04070, partial [Chloroflexota bacterium]
MINRILNIGLVIIISLFGLLVGCSPAEEPTNTTIPTNANGTSKDSKEKDQPHVINIFLNDTQVATISSEQLKGLGEISVHVQSTDREVMGPTLLSVLSLADINDFTEVTVIGLKKGRKQPAEFTLDKQLASQQVILSFNNIGTMKLVGADLPWDVVIDIS